jgi:SagB-type dehydrogenase family enzyme
MTRHLTNFSLPRGNQADEAWEIFHENSKLNEYERFLPDELMTLYMDQVLQSLSYDTFPEVNLPAALTNLDLAFSEVLAKRETARALHPTRLKLEDLATLLHHAYGVTRDNKDQVFQRPFRSVPSADALYPLELFFHTTHVTGLAAGLYHYNPIRNSVSFLRGGDHSGLIAAALTQKHLAISASLIVFITAMFERTTLKYGNRGYRFVLLEAGHVAQNLSLVAAALDLGCVSIGGYFDREIDELFSFDGLTQSTIYLLALGEKVVDPPAAES